MDGRDAWNQCRPSGCDDLKYENLKKSNKSYLEWYPWIKNNKKKNRIIITFLDGRGRLVEREWFSPLCGPKIWKSHKVL
jgi:hypothetical protein